MSPVLKFLQSVTLTVQSNRFYSPLNTLTTLLLHVKDEPPHRSTSLSKANVLTKNLHARTDLVTRFCFEITLLLSIFLRGRDTIISREVINRWWCFLKSNRRGCIVFKKDRLVSIGSDERTLVATVCVHQQFVDSRCLCSNVSRSRFGWQTITRRSNC